MFCANLRGYTRAKFGFDGDTCGVMVSIKEQSTDIALGVDQALEAKQGSMDDSDIEAIGAGKRAANAIDRYLAGIPQPKIPPVPVRRGRVDWIDVTASSKMILERPRMPLLMIERRRTTFQQVELGLDEKMVQAEIARIAGKRG